MDTPNLDRLAFEGTWFDNHYMACPLCVPARMSFLVRTFGPHFPYVAENGWQLDRK